MSRSDSSITLYSYWRSSCSWRVRIALHLKNIPYKYVAVNLKTGEQFDNEYKKQNPMQQVPALVIDGQALAQSVAIMEYLDETRRFSGHRLLPDNPKSRALVRMMTEIVNSGIQPLQKLPIMKRVIAIRQSYESFDVPQKVKYMFKWGRDSIVDGFIALEQLLAKQNDGKGFKFCTDDINVTMADVVLVPQVVNAMRYGVDMSQFPTIKRIHDNLMELDAFKETAPSQMIDAIPPSKL
eukprot:108440_1